MKSLFETYPKISKDEPKTQVRENMQNMLRQLTRQKMTSDCSSHVCVFSNVTVPVFIVSDTMWPEIATAGPTL